MRCVPAVAAALALAGCAPDLSSPLAVAAITWDAQGRQFQLARVKLGTLHSLRRLAGESGTVTAGGRVRVSAAAVRDASATVDSLREKFVEAPPGRVDITWSVIDDTAWPEDFASLELVSIYNNVEKARAALAQWDLADLPARPIVAHADLADERGLSPLAAGELYFPPLAAFYAPAPSAGQQMPASFNPGAMAHALGHQAVQQLAWKGAPAPAAEVSGDETARHLARSMAEGIADFLAVAASGDPRWMDHSLVQDAVARTLDQIRCSTPAMLDALAVAESDAPYDPYPLGAVLAGALWEQAVSANLDDLARGVLAALPDLGAASGLAGMLEVLAVHAPGDQRAALCGLFINRFGKMGITGAAIPACATVTLRKECK